MTRIQTARGELKNDLILKSIVSTLRKKFHCHTIILYGSRARGQISPTSDYDVVGVCRRGKKTRLAKKQRGSYWDVFVYPEKDLKQLGPQQMGWKMAKIIYQENEYGKKLLKRIRALLQKPHRPEPLYELKVLKIWAQKQLDRCQAKDLQGLYRRAEFQSTLIEHYFVMRKKRYSGPKEGFLWLQKNDPQTYKALYISLQNPDNLSLLAVVASRVYKVKFLV